MEATLLSAIGETYGGLGMPDRSFPVFQRAVALRRRILGEDHAETVQAFHNLAMAYQDAGRFDAAIDLLERNPGTAKSRSSRRSGPR